MVDASVVERVGRMTDEDQYLNTIFMFWTRTLKHNYRFESCPDYLAFVWGKRSSKLAGKSILNTYSWEDSVNRDVFG